MASTIGHGSSFPARSGEPSPGLLGLPAPAKSHAGESEYERYEILIEYIYTSAEYCHITVFFCSKLSSK